MKKILVTGANGFVGKHLVKELIESSYSVSAITGTTRNAINFGDGVEVSSVDLSVSDEVDKIDMSDIDAVVHLAGLAAVAPSFEQPLRYIAVNSALEINLFQSAIKQDVRPRFIIISSGSLYAADARLPLTEKSSVAGNSPYAVSKLTQENIGLYYATRGFEVILARPFNHIGPGQGPGFLAADLASQVVACERGQQELVHVGNLDAQRDYTDVRDIALAYRLLLERGRTGEIYNICSGKPRSGHELLKAILNESNTQPNIQQDPDKMRPSDSPLIYGSHDKLSEHTGWMPQIKLSETVHDIVQYWREL